MTNALTFCNPYFNYNHHYHMNKILAANRSEIAVRIFRSASELNYRTVALFANEDRLESIVLKPMNLT